jgi:hypothetical protein
LNKLEKNQNRVEPTRQSHGLNRGAQAAPSAFEQRRSPPCPCPRLRCRCSCPPFPPPSSTASCGFNRSALPKELLISSSSVHASPLLLLAPCRRRPPHLATEAPPESTTSPLPGRPSFRSFLREKALRTAAAATIPLTPDTSHHQASPAALLLRRRHTNNRPCPGHLSEPRVADHHHRTPPLTVVPLRPSRAPPWKLPLS